MGFEHCARCPFKVWFAIWDTAAVISCTCRFCDELQVTAESFFRCPLLIIADLHCVSLRPVRKALPSCGLINHCAPHLQPVGVTFLVVITEVSIAETPLLPLREHYIKALSLKQCTKGIAFASPAFGSPPDDMGSGSLSLRICTKCSSFSRGEASSVWIC